ncbi:MAG TPA: long-chain-fatty-acid--CoA ligase [Dehalococcoidia bacterium]|nr:long-chain-fatty-acid--CoA ligase [Dehalococcoidia bacterium]
MNTTDFLTIAVAIVPDRPAVLFEGKSFTFAQIAESANRLANALLRIGIKKEDRVGVIQVNCNEFLEIYNAIAKAGAIMVPLNFRAKEDELAYMLNNAEAKVLFVGDRYLDLVRNMRPHAPSVKQFISIDSKQPDMLYYKDLLARAPADDVFTDIGDDDVTILMYTAGTTGRPKGVPLSHSGFVSYMLNNVQPADPEVNEVNLLTVPLYHVAGIQAMLAATYGGRTLAMMRQFEAKEWMETVQHAKATRAMLVPTMLKRVIDDPDFNKYDLSSLKVITYGAAPMPFEVIKKAIEALPNVRFINAFGQTETASTICMLGPEDHDLRCEPALKEKKLRRLQSSIGLPLPDVEMKGIDEEGKDLPPGEVGMIVARGPRVMGGYWKDAEKTAQAMTPDGWLRTNDMGYRDEDGYFYLAGRADDMIIRGGENISPEEVENVLYAHPKVEEVAVIGVSDEEWGQEVMAVCVLKPGQAATREEIIDFCRGKVSSFKRPRHVVFCAALPRNPMGKVLKRTLRQKYAPKK